MAPHRKSPVHYSAAMFSQVHPSETIWVVFEQDRHSGKFSIHLTGRFKTEFKADHEHWPPAFTTEFVTNYEDPYYGIQHWCFTAGQLGLIPDENVNWFNEKLTAEKLAERQSCRSYLVPDRRDPCFMWQRRFVVKLQNAHKVFGCTPQEFRDQHLTAFHRNLEITSEFQLMADEEDARYAAAQEAAWAEL